MPAFCPIVYAAKHEQKENEREVVTSLVALNLAKQIADLLIRLQFHCAEKEVESIPAVRDGAAAKRSDLFRVGLKPVS